MSWAISTSYGGVTFAEAYVSLTAFPVPRSPLSVCGRFGDASGDTNVGAARSRCVSSGRDGGDIDIADGAIWIFAGSALGRMLVGLDSAVALTARSESNVEPIQIVDAILGVVRSIFETTRIPALQPRAATSKLVLARGRII